MRSSVKALSVVAALAMAVGLSACDEEEVSQPSSGGASASSSARADSDESDASPSDDSQEDKDSKGSKDDKKSQDSKGKSGETTKSGSTIQNIQPVTFKDEEIGLTQTCDKVIEDYAARQAVIQTRFTCFTARSTSVEILLSAARSWTPPRSRTKRNPGTRRMSTGRCWPTT